MRFPFRPNLVSFSLRTVEYASAIYAGVTGARAKFAHAPAGHWTEGKGSLTVHRGWRFLHLQGSPYEMGRQHGALLKPLIGDLINIYLTAIHRFRRLSRRKLLAKARLLEPFVAPELVEEMRGIAAGAGVSYDDILLGHTFLESLQSIACSCYAAWDDATADGKLVCGRNLEFFSMGVAHLAHVIIFQKPDHGIPFISVAWPGWCGALTAANLQGLSLGLLNVNRFTREPPGEPYALLFRRLVQHCADCDQAAQLIRAASRTYSNNILIAQTAPVRNAVVVEYTHDQLAVRTPRPGNHFILATNHFRKLGRETELPEGRGHFRYPALHRLLQQHAGRLTSRTDLFGHPRVHFPDSMHCFIIAPERREFRLAFGALPATDAPYRTFTYTPDGINLPPLDYRNR